MAERPAYTSQTGGKDDTPAEDWMNYFDKDCPDCGSQYECDCEYESQAHSKVVVARKDYYRMEWVKAPNPTFDGQLAQAQVCYIRKGDTCRVTTYFTYKPKGPRVRYYRKRVRVAKGPNWQAA